MSNTGLLARLLACFAGCSSVAFGLCLFVSTATLGHEVRPAYIELKEEAALGTFDVLFKTPMQGDLRLSLSVTFSGRVEPVTPVLSRVTDNAMVQTWRVRATDRLAGQQVRVVGLDHLLFVLGLILITANLRQVVKAITAFTAAHSITLASAALGFAHVPPKPVEAAIALSIAFVALEIIHARTGNPGIAAKAPWIVAFGFGLLHGFGFAGALSEIGMPAGHIPVALLFFNVGVEAGQLLFVAAVMVLAALV